MHDLKPPEHLIGQILGGAYKIQSRLDEGGMGTVFLAEHVRLRRPVAVKVMSGHLAEADHALARFAREAEIISQLHHPHVVQVLDFDTTEEGRPYLVMELLKGRALDNVLSKHSKLGIGPAIRVAVQAASALGAAHQAGIVHRDLKPANIFLVDTGDQLFVKLLDFGISKKTIAETRDRKLTGEFDILGTPEYMSPEQALGKTASVDARADQYALAVILYEMLTGRVPFTSDDVMDLLQRVIRDIPIAPSALRDEISKELDQIILRALAKNPLDRFDSILEFSDALELSSGTSRSDSSPIITRARSTPANQKPTVGASLFPTEPSTGTRRTSWHSRDPAQSVRDLIDRIRQELGLDNLEIAVNCAESVIEIAQSNKSDEINALIAANAALLQRVFERRLGGLHRTLIVSASAGRARGLSPEQAFLLSRLEGGLSIEEALDLSPMSKAATLAHLVGLMRLGHVSLGA